ncbi:MAG: hypothetical protein GYA36_20095 [Veillonellaceae bacterium]|nr:hypothetical protein [Veillonellaceae bacterium]
MSSIKWWRKKQAGPLHPPVGVERPGEDRHLPALSRLSGHTDGSFRHTGKVITQA